VVEFPLPELEILARGKDNKERKQKVSEELAEEPEVPTQ